MSLSRVSLLAVVVTASLLAVAWVPLAPAADTGGSPRVPVPQAGDVGAYEVALVTWDGERWHERTLAEAWSFRWLGERDGIAPDGSLERREDALVRVETDATARTFVQSHGPNGAVRALQIEQQEDGVRYREEHLADADGLPWLPLCFLRNGLHDRTGDRFILGCSGGGRPWPDGAVKTIAAERRGDSTVWMVALADRPASLQAWVSSESAYPLVVFRDVGPGLWERWTLVGGDRGPDGAEDVAPLVAAAGVVSLAPSTGWGLPDHDLDSPFRLQEAFEGAVARDDRRSPLARFLWDHPSAYVAAAAYSMLPTQIEVAQQALSPPKGGERLLDHQWKFTVTDGQSEMQVTAQRTAAGAEPLAVMDQYEYSEVGPASQRRPWSDGVPNLWPTAQSAVDALAARLRWEAWTLTSLEFSLQCGDHCYDGRLALEVALAEPGGGQARFIIDADGATNAWAVSVEGPSLAHAVVWDMNGAAPLAVAVYPHIETGPTQFAGAGGFYLALLLVWPAMVALTVALFVRAARRGRRILATPWRTTEREKR